MQYLNQDEKTKSPFIINDDITHIDSTIICFRIYTGLIEFLLEDKKQVTLSTYDVINYIKWLHPNLTKIAEIGTKDIKENKETDPIQYVKNCIIKYHKEKNITEAKEAPLYFINDVLECQHPIWDRLRFLSFNVLLEIVSKDQDLLEKAVDNHPNVAAFFTFSKNNKVKKEEFEDTYKKFLVVRKKKLEQEKKEQDQKKFEKKMTVLLKDVIEGNHNIPGLKCTKVETIVDNKVVDSK